MKKHNHIKTILITPSLAHDWLQKNTRNRPLSQRHVDMLADEMKHGRWKFNGDTICFAGGTLLDGQHRLWAIIRSGIAQFMIVVNNLDSDVFDTIDYGKKRDAAAVLALNGEVNTQLLAATLRIVDDYLNGKVKSRVVHTNTKIEELLKIHPETRESVLYAQRLAYKRLLPGSIVAGFHYLFSKLNPLAADYFFTALIKGVGLEEGDPIYLLREKLLYNQVSTKKLVRASYAALVIKTWNYHSEGKKIKRLTWSDSKTASTRFPVIKRAA